MSDAPDWQRTVTGPGGAPVGGAPGLVTPADYGFAGWTMPHYAAWQSSNFTSAAVYCALVKWASSQTISEIGFECSGLPTTLDAGANYVGIYGPASLTGGWSTTVNLLAASASGAADTAAWARPVTYIPLSSPLAVVAGTFAYIAVLFHYGASPAKPPSLASAQLESLDQVSVAADPLFVTSFNTGLNGYAALPASITPASGPRSNKLMTYAWAR